jgi:hypothetical protein
LRKARDPIVTGKYLDRLSPNVQRLGVVSFFISGGGVKDLFILGLGVNDLAFLAFVTSYSIGVCSRFILLAFIFFN